MWPKACASKLYGTAHARFVAVKRLQFVGFSINVAHLFVFAGTSWESPVPEAGTKILTVQLGSYTLIFGTIFGFNII